MYCIFSSPSIFSSVKILTLLKDNLMQNNETDVRASLHANESSFQLSSYNAKAGFLVQGEKVFIAGMSIAQ